MWFEQLFGFPERIGVRGRLEVRGDRLHSLVNGRSYAIGRFSTPTLGELRRAAARAPRGAIRVQHEAIGDVLELHARPENAGALFQVASQFNCLEFASPHVTPEHGVTGYAHDPTQGPACSLAAAAATVYRNDFVPMGDHVGQAADRQLDNLDDLAAALGAPDQFFTVRNGYTHSDPGRLGALPAAMARHEREDLLATVKIGLHQDVGVTFASRYRPPAGEPRVSQAFCSAVSCAYTDLPLQAWKPLATLVLDATYEATLLAAAVDAAEGHGSGKVWLTFLGGGVFGNPRSWIADAMRRAIHRARDLELDVRIAHYRHIDDGLRRAVEAP